MCNLSEIILDQGKNLRDQEMIAQMLRQGKQPLDIADFCGYSLSQVLAVQKELKKELLPAAH